MIKKGFLLALLAAAAAPGCEDDGVLVNADASDADATDEAETDGEGELPPCDAIAPPETGGAGADISLPVPAGQARAGKITDPALVPTGPKSWAELGDILIRNARVGFVIEDTGGGEGYRSQGYNPFGGEIVYADRWTGAGPAGENLVGEIFYGFGLQMIDPETVTVIADGSDGGDAVVRVTGPLVAMPLLDEAAGELIDPFPFNGEMFIDYSLGGDDDFLRVTFTARNVTTRIVRIFIPVFGAIMGDGLRLMTPEGGFDDEAFGDAHAWYGYVGDRVSYAAADGRGGDLTYFLEESGILVASLPAPVEIEACGETVLPAVDIFVAGGGAEALEAAVRRAKGEAEPASLGGIVTLDDGTPAPGAWVHVLRDDGSYATSDVAGEDGAWSVALAPGGYEVTAVLDGYRPAGPQAASMEAADRTLDLRFPPSGTLLFTVVDGEGAALPSKLIVVPETAPEGLPAAFGVQTLPGGASAVLFDVDGAGELVLPPGRYAVTASRGYRYEIDEAEVEVTENGSANADLVVPEVVDASGYLCGDFHQHSIWSADSEVPPEISVAASMAEGMELLVSTDHDWIVSYQYLVEAMGVENWIKAFAGSEVTSYEYGHFNAYPLTVREGERNNGSVDNYYTLPGEVFAEILTDPLGPVVQVNHPRSGAGGYFDYVGLDPATCQVENADYWSTLWSAIEVFNGSDFRSSEEASVQDWFGLLRCGYRFTVTGNSDSHDVYSSERGFPRNCLFFGHDDPAAVTEASFLAALRSLDVVVSGGIFVTVDVGGAGMGDTADAPGGEADVDVVVQAPEWMAADRLRVFVDGVETETIVLDETTRDPANPVVRYGETVHVSTGGADGFVVIVAEGDRAMDPVVRGKLPFAATNPVFLDADGDGVFTPM